MNSDSGRGPCSFSAEFLRSVIDNLPLVVLVKDAAELRFELVNRAGEALLGRRREELIGRTAHAFFTKEQADFFRANDREALASTRPIDVCEEPISTPEGVRWLRTVKMAIRDDAGVARHLLGLSEDITVKRDLADKLRHAHMGAGTEKLGVGIARDLELTDTPQFHVVPLRVRRDPRLDALTERERAVLTGLLEHRRVPAIAEHLGISAHTVRNHLKSVYAKLRVSSQQELLDLILERPPAEDAPGLAPDANIATPAPHPKVASANRPSTTYRWKNDWQRRR